MNKLPDDYIAFERLLFCSNILVNVKVPIVIKEQFPLLIGAGAPVPLIWLYATKKGKEWLPVVEKNRPVNKNYLVNFLNDGASVQVVLGNTLIIQAARLSEKTARADLLDLRPLGIDIRGNQTGLQVGQNMLSHNEFQNLNAMIAIGPIKETIKLSGSPRTLARESDE